MSAPRLDLTFETLYPYPREVVWEALTDSRALAAWFFDNDFEPRVGTTFTLQTRHLGLVTCIVRALDPPRMMEWEWRDAVSPAPTIVAFRLEEVDGGTRLVIRHSGSVVAERRDDIVRGWPAKLRSLETWLASSALGRPARPA